MLEFDMPDTSEEVRYNRTRNALEPLIGKPARNATKFSLELAEGDMLKPVMERTGLAGFKKRFGLGCPVSDEAPYFEYSLKDNGTEIRYKRKIQTVEKGFYKDGVACLERIVPALNDISICLEYFSLYKRKEIAAKVFRDDEGWRLMLNRCEVGGKELEREGFDMPYAVNTVLDFYEANNL